jgi:starvation-inducible DNA-binding protein
MTDPSPNESQGGRLDTHSIGHIARTQRISINDAAFVEPSDMLAELQRTIRRPQDDFAVTICVQHRDIATASPRKGWIDETERTVLYKRAPGDSSGH